MMMDQERLHFKRRSKLSLMLVSFLLFIPLNFTSTRLKKVRNRRFVVFLFPVDCFLLTAFEQICGAAGGLLGSQAVAQSYAKQGKGVRAMLQQVRFSSYLSIFIP